MPGIGVWVTDRGDDLLREERAICKLMLPADAYNQLRAAGKDWYAGKLGIAAKVILEARIAHTSRKFEWPWLIVHGCISPGIRILDAGGCGNSPLKYRMASLGGLVTVADIDEASWRKEESYGLLAVYSGRISFCRADLMQLPFSDGSYDRVVCASTLEHLSDPLQAVQEMWRVLKPGGRLLISMDVANYHRWNHTVDSAIAAWILKELAVTIEPPTTGVHELIFKEIDPQPGEPAAVSLRVLCFYSDKPS